MWIICFFAGKAITGFIDIKNLTQKNFSIHYKTHQKNKIYKKEIVYGMM